MAENIDSLQIEINAQAGKANDAIDRLINRIDKLTTSIGHLDGKNLTTLANGVQKLGTAMLTMNNINYDGFANVSRNLKALNKLDTTNILNLSRNVKNISDSLRGFKNVSKSIQSISDLANGIKQLGYKSADKAIGNIPQLATAMKKLMAELSTAPKVSRNIIDMTNALAKFARTGSSGGKAANTLVNSFNRVSKASIGMKFNMLGAVSGITSLSKSLLSAAGIAGGFYAVIRGIKESINISSDLTEVQNVVDVTFGNFKQKIEDLANVSIPELGMSELTVKQIASRFQAMGVAMGISQKGMADMSTELTRLAGDMASFYNVEQKAVGEDLESIFTGQTKPLRQYGLDLTEATLQEWAMKQGIDANVNSMSQMEKTMLRYQYVMANTKSAQNDFRRTQDTWANQLRILQENFKALGSVIGTTFINALKPLVSALNNAMSHIIAFAKVVSNSLGKIFGWKYEDTSGGVANNYADAADSADDLAAGTGKAADNAKKLRQQLQKVDELNVLSSNKDTGSGGGSGSGGGATGGVDASGGQWIKTDSILKDYESQLDTLYKLGEHIGNTLTNAMKSIDWNGIYDGAKNFGSGLASFLNGLISPELFGEVGKTIAASLNTALYSLNSFGKTFDWKDFGESIASGINNFFSTFDFKNAADTINVWMKGVLTTASTLLKKTDFEAIGKKIGEFLKELDFDEISEDLASTIWEAIKSAFGLVKGLFEEAPLETALITAFGILKFTGLGEAIAGKIGTAISTSLASKLASALGLELAENAGIGTAIKTAASSIGGKIITSIGTAISGAGSALSSFATTVWSALGSALSSATTALSTLGSTIVSGIGTALSSIGSFLTSSVSTVFAGGAASIAAGLFAAIGAAIGGWKIGNLIYDKFSEQIDSIVEKVGDFFTKTVPQALSNAGKAVFDFALNLKGNIDEKAQQIKDWFADKTTPVKEFVAKAKTEGKDKIDGLKESWNKLTSGLKSVNLKAIAKATGKSAIDNIKKSWDKLLKSKQVQNLKVAFQDNFTRPLKDAWNRLAKVINNGIVGMNKILPKNLEISVRVPTFAIGGFPEDGWFRASHGEMIGKFDNGQSVVANNNQITEGISAAVYKGNQQMVSYMQQEITELRMQNQLLTELLNKEVGISYSDVGKASQKYAREYTNRTGKPAYI